MKLRLDIISKFSGLTAAVLFGTGCDAVLTKTPVVLEVSGDVQKELAGSWENDEGFLTVSFSGDGVGVVNWEEEADGKKVKKSAEFYALKKGSWHFLSFRRKHPDKEEEWYFFSACRLKNNGELILYAPRIDAFSQLVEVRKAVSGHVEKNKYSTTVRVKDGPGLVDLVAGDPEKYFEAMEGGLRKRKP